MMKNSIDPTSKLGGFLLHVETLQILFKFQQPKSWIQD